ncbi:general substrate transporter [Dioszegia hungarica]|uniref:General substrate transporter n=1 Tax=Dioszegia hungarica TaxID=4972 RepID=A0AA38H3Z9_9TREE|nr:general substrate transporter [Dioszegia hungarica]KAI9631839.1 general substrate transporter [Dioszegia hungarica]
MAGGFAELQNNANPIWYRDKGLRKMSLHVVMIFFAVFTFGYDGAYLNGLLIVPAWGKYFGNPAGQDLGLITASFYFPKIITPPLAAWISDKYGRRVSIMVGSVVTLAGGLLGAFSTSRGQFIGGRVMVGAGQAFHQAVAPPLLQELAHPRVRGIVGAMYLGIFFVGSIFSAFLTLGMINWDSEWAWRLPTLLQVLGTIIISSYILAGQMPESPRWQLRNGRGDRALKTLAELHANGDENDELVRYEFAEMEESLRADEGAATVSYLEFFRTHGNRRRLLVTCVVAAGAQLGGITEPPRQAGINAGLSIWGLVCVMTAAQFIDRLGRRVLWMQGLIGMFIWFSFITALSGAFASTGSQAIGTAVIPFLFLFQMANTTSFTTVAYMYATEINPYALRSKALSIYISVQGVALSFNQYVNPIALAAIAWKYYFVFSGIQIFLIVFAWFFFLETRGCTIEEASLLYDGPEAVARASEKAAQDTHDMPAKKEDAEQEFVEGGDVRRTA